MNQMKGSKAMRRAAETADVIRISGEVPLITDKTELITPAMAQEMLQKNENNRPINWDKVEEYADIMRKGEWKLTSQGIILDPKGNILTGQKRLWAIIYADRPVYMRVSKGCPADTVRVLDRGAPQTSKDLASRETKRKHSPVEPSIARAMLIGMSVKPNADKIADILVERDEDFKLVLKETKGTKKTKAIMMVLAAVFLHTTKAADIILLSRRCEELAQRLDESLAPTGADKCWGRGVSFTLAMEQAKKIVG